MKSIRKQNQTVTNKIFSVVGRWVTNLLLICSMVGVAIFLLCFYYGRGLPECDYLRHYEPCAVTQLYTAEGNIFQEYAKEKRIFIPLTHIPPLLIQAFLAAEDKNFYHHCGVDSLGIVRAFIKNCAAGCWNQHPNGASTITQQVAKIFLVGSKRSFDRKIEEAIMAFRLERTLSKHRILELYLNEIYLGAKSFGVASAALTYFNKLLHQLTLAEIALLASLPKSPAFYDPYRHLEKTKKRRDWIIGRLVEEGVISSQEAKIACSETITLYPQAELPRQAAYFSEDVKRFVIALLGTSAFELGGLAIQTTLSPTLQKKAEEALRQGLIAYDRRHGWRGPVAHLSIDSAQKTWVQELVKMSPPKGSGVWQQAVVLGFENQGTIIGLSNGETGYLPLSLMKWAYCKGAQSSERVLIPVEKIFRIGDVILVKAEAGGVYSLQQVPEVNGAIVVMNPYTGSVLAMSGGYEFEISQFNCASQAMRQPGSAFKPFVYLSALEQGYQLNTLIADTPIALSLGRNLGVYTPQNISKRFYGLIPLRYGLERSHNVMTVRLAYQVGMHRVARMAERFGITNHMPSQLAMALGAGETTLLKLTTAYAMIANGGHHVIPHLVQRICDRYSQVIYRHHPTMGAQLWEPSLIKSLILMLRGVVEHGTAQELKSLGLPVAGKTGTTNQYKDAWFIGFTSDLVVGVFVGFLYPKSLGAGETGSRVAVPIFKSFMQSISGLNSDS